MTSLAEGLSEEIVTGLSRFSYLRVMARGQTVQVAHQAADARSAGQALGARYVLEGSLRQAGSQLRVAVQLVDTTTGAHLWAETYNRPFDSSDLFGLQDDLVPRIVSTVADAYGVLPHSMSQAVRSKPFEQLSPDEALLRSLSYAERVTAEEHAEAKAGLERALQQAPAHSDCWAMLSIMLADEYGHGFGAAPETLEGALRAARRAVDANPSNHRAYQALAWALYLRKEFVASRHAGERALALNPMDACTAVYVGQTLAYSGDWDRGCALIARAIELNPHHPGWYWYASFLNAYRHRDYRTALAAALKMNLPGVSLVDVALAATYGQLGDGEAARQAIRELLAGKPDYAAIARQELEKWFDAEIVAHLIDGLRKAGLDIERAESAPARVAERPKTDGQASTPSIAVLPFTNMSADKEQEYFSDGLAEELLNALSKIDDLKVAARTSAFSFKGKSVNASEIGARLGVNHILEGSVRRSGNRLRISVQLVNASDGFHLWSNRYDSEMRDLFVVQDEITLAVVGALKGMLFGAEKAALLKRYTDDAAVHELFLKGRYYANKYSGEGWTRAIEFFQRAIDMQPDHAPSHAGMAVCYGCLWYFGLLPAGQTVPQCKAATRKALEIDGTLADAHLPLAIITFFYDWEWERAEQAFQQSVALNSNNAEALSYYALFLAFEGRADEALAQAQRALEIDPLSPLINMTVGWAYFSTGRSDDALDQVGKMIEIEPDFYGAYWLKGAIRLAEGRYADAVEALKRAVSLGGHPIVVADLGSAYGLAARREDATSILDQLLEMRRRAYVPATCIARVSQPARRDRESDRVAGDGV